MKIIKQMKKVVVFGASGGTGKQVVEQALQAGYAVTAVVRNPENFTIFHSNLHIIKGDVLTPASFQNELNGAVAVVSCLGIPKIQPTTLYSVGMRHIVSVLQDSGVERIICISSGALDIPPKSSFIMRFLLKNVLQRIYKPIYTDMRLMEKTLLASSLDWTIVRAPKLTDGRKTGKYRDITGQGLNGIPQISRADLADYMLSHLFDQKTFKKTVDIAY